MNKNMLKTKKAISPILATLLLIVIAVAAIVVTYAWVMTYMSTTTGQAGVILKKDTVSWGPANTTIIVYVRNTGIENGYIDAVYVGTSATNLTEYAATYAPTSGLVTKKGEGTNKITITYSAVWTTKTTYYFRITPKVGAPLEFNEEAP